MLRCPACSCLDIQPQSPHRFGQRGGDFLPNNYQLLVCSNCGLWFKDNIPSKDSLKRHYDSLKVEVSLWNYFNRWPHEQKLDNILSKLADKSRVLDVGCWTGRLLTLHYPRLNLYGIEPNASAAAVAKQNGLQILDSEVTENLPLFGSFNCIIMVDVFEHLQEPMRILNCLFSALAPEGKLIIVTGRTDCFPIWFSGSTYWYFACADHLVFLNRRFAMWLQEKMPARKVNFLPVHHFYFEWTQYFYEFAWLLCWRFFSSQNLFAKSVLHHLPGFKKFARLREPLTCSVWKDHVIIEIQNSA